MDIRITKEIFEMAVPAFKSPTPSTFEKVQPFLEDAEYCIVSLLSGFEPETNELQSRVEHLICTLAAYKAIPELDLVLTPTGFGVVNNQNQAPASQARVAALTESLRKRVSDATDLLLFGLKKEPLWNETARAKGIFSSLLWCPTIVRRYGIKLKEDGVSKDVYADEFKALAHEIELAETDVRMALGAELYYVLCQKERKNELSAAYEILAERTRTLMATDIMRGSYPRSYLSARRDFERTLGQFANQLPEYINSSEYRAKKAKRYENKKDDPTFFFG